MALFDGQEFAALIVRQGRFPLGRQLFGALGGGFRQRSRAGGLPGVEGVAHQQVGLGQLVAEMRQGVRMAEEVLPAGGDVGDGVQCERLVVDRHAPVDPGRGVGEAD